MLDSPTIDGLRALRLDAMAAALAEQHEQASYTGLGFDERLGLLVDRELTARSNRKLERHLKTAGSASRQPSRTSTSATPGAWTRRRSSPWPRPTGPAAAAPSSSPARPAAGNLPGLRPRARRDPQRPYRALPACPADAR